MPMKKGNETTTPLQTQSTVWQDIMMIIIITTTRTTTTTTTTTIIIIIINLIYIAQFDTNGILPALYIVIQFIQMQYVHI